MSQRRGWILRGALSAVCLMALGTSEAAAQGRIGGEGMYQSELFNGTFGLGARAQLDLGFLFSGASVLGTYDVYFPSNCGADCSLSEIGGNVLFSGGTAFYFGLGGALQRFDRPEDLETTEDWIAHFVVGLNIPGTPILTPFVEARFEALSGTTNQQVFAIGLMFGPRQPEGSGRRGR